jgi:putative hemolysin
MIKKSTYNKFIIGLVTSLIVAAFFGGYTHVSEAQTSDTKSGMANPASLYCIDHGGKDKIVIEKNGSQIGICVFSNGSLCEEWQYFRGQCTPTDTTPSPLSQVQTGLDPSDITCVSGLQLILKATDGSPACVKPASATKLLQWGWASKIISSTHIVDQVLDNNTAYRHRDVFFMKPNSTAQLDVRYHATWDYPGMVNFDKFRI